MLAPWELGTKSGIIIPAPFLSSDSVAEEYFEDVGLQDSASETLESPRPPEMSSAVLS